MKIKQEIINIILGINMKIILHKNKGNKLRVRFYQSLLSWIISKELKTNGYRI